MFVTKKDKFIRGGKQNIILSPEFYWVKKVKLPVKNVSAAKRLAASVYEGALPEGNYSYEVRKAGDEFIIIAYDKKNILDDLKKVFPAKSTFKEVYFAQDVLDDIKECTAVNEHSALANIDGIIVSIPSACADTDSNSKLADILESAKPKKHRISLSASSNELLQRADVIALSIFSLIVGASFLLEYINYKNETNKLEEQRAKIQKEYKLPPTMIQLKSIKKSLNKKFKSQKSIRDLLNTLSTLILKKDEYIEQLDLNKQSLSLKIHTADPKRESQIKKSLSKKAKIESSSYEGDSLSLRISL